MMGRDRQAVANMPQTPPETRPILYRDDHFIAIHKPARRLPYNRATASSIAFTGHTYFP